MFLQQFINSLRNTCGVTPQNKLLLACSGGVDSMVLASLLLLTKQPFAIAHCNFQLRGEASFGDEAFVKQWAEEHQIPFFLKRFDTEKLKEEEGSSTQMLARKLRYDWFNLLLQEEHFDYLLTAHHLDDSVETFFINLSRGTGLAGLAGIASNKNQVLRPLHIFTKDMLLDYAKQQKLTWREDASNESDDYLRNKIRHHIVPQLSALNDHFYDSFLHTTQLVAEANTHLQSYYKLLLNKCQLFENEYDTAKLSAMPECAAVLHFLLNPLGFTSTQVANIGAALLQVEQKYFLSNTNQLVISRGKLQLTILGQNPQNIAWNSLEELQKSTYFKSAKLLPAQDVILELKKTNSVYKNSNIALFDLEKLVFPLRISFWEKGDFFYPFGLKGKKLISDFYIDLKFDANRKQNQPLLRSENEILWVVGERIGERCSVKSDTKLILCLEID